MNLTGQEKVLLAALVYRRLIDVQIALGETEDAYVREKRIEQVNELETLLKKVGAINGKQ